MFSFGLPQVENDDDIFATSENFVLKSNPSFFSYYSGLHRYTVLLVVR